MLDFFHMNRVSRKIKPSHLACVADHHFPVLLQPDETGGFWALCPSLQGCYSQGETVEQALNNIREAIGLCLEDSPKRSSSIRDVSLHFVRV